jgi:hypothetical protein
MGASVDATGPQPWVPQGLGVRGIATDRRLAVLGERRLFACGGALAGHDAARDQTAFGLAVATGIEVAKQALDAILEEMWAEGAGAECGHNYNRIRLLKAIAKDWAHSDADIQDLLKEAERAFREKNDGMVESNRTKLRHPPSLCAKTVTRGSVPDVSPMRIGRLIPIIGAMP